MKKRIYWIVLGILILFVGISGLSSWIIDYQWFKEVGYISVFLTSLKSRIFIFIPLFLLVFLLLSLYIRYLRKNYITSTGNVIDAGREKKIKKLITYISFIISAIVSASFTGMFWYRILEYINGVDFNVKSPVFNKDASFFVFKMPLLQGITGVLTTIVMLLIAVTLVFYFIVKARDGIVNLRSLIKGNESPQARFIGKQLAILGGVFLLLLSAIFYFKGLNLVYSPRGVAFGASYTDVHVTLPMYRIISIACIVAAFIVAFSIIKKKIKLIIYTAAFIAVLIFVEGIAAGIVEKVVVNPNTKEKEMPYLIYNIDLTRKAFNLDNIEERSFPVDYNLTQKDIDANKNTIENIRINEFSQSLEVYNQIQSIRNYYKFNDVDIDRYIIDGQLRQVFTAVRELDNSNKNTSSQNWQNLHLFYTHGYGAVMAYTNKVGSTGLPEFIVKDIPVSSEGKFKIDKPQIYFGEINDDYVIVEAKNNEIDYPYGNENKENRYDGKAGIRLTLLNRWLFTINKGSFNFILSNNISSDSKIILNRNVLNRVRKIAPFINYDNDPYIVFANDRYYWIIDGYTTTDKFPFSEPYKGVNYIRNSVKVVVDAYDGTVDYYLSDPNDAVAATMGNIYKGLFKDIKTMPEELKKHLRYSEDAFIIQSKVYEKYHVEDAAVFYNGQDAWNVAKYKGADGKDVEVAPLYQVMRLPGEKNEEFLLTLPYTVANRENMVSWLAVRMDKDAGANMVLMKFPREKSVYGPQQFNSKINTDTTIAGQLTLLSQRGSEVILGETTIIPINNSIIFVRPLYLKSQGGRSLPELKKVIVQYGDAIVMEDNIQTAFKRLFNVKMPEETGVTPPGITLPDESINQLANQASDLFIKAKEAQMKGDWAGYGDYLNKLEDVLNRLKEKSK